MHFTLLIVAFVISVGFRSLWRPALGSWSDRWRWTLGAFVLPPLLLLTSALSVVWMGPKAQMIHGWDGWGSYGVAIAGLGFAIAVLARLAWQGGRSLQAIRQCVAIDVQGKPGRLLPTPMPFIAQIGFWTPELVVSEGLLETLDTEHLNAVLVHEQAHHDYRDTFWFFWLGWLRRLGAGLPQTEALWEELLVLREMRADRVATQAVDRLVLAEALVSVVSASLTDQPLCAAFSSAEVGDRLSERIDAILSETTVPTPMDPIIWIWLLVGLLPLAIVPFHGPFHM